MKEVLLYNHSGFGNRGCEAIVASTALLFAEKAHVMVASRTPEMDKQNKPFEVSRIIGDTISPYSLERVINSIGFRLGIPRENEILRKHSPVVRAGKGKICLSVGGDTYCYGEQEHLRFINKKLKKDNSKLILWGCSVDTDLLNGQILEDLRIYDLIIPRESMTAEAMKSCGLPVYPWIDPAFYLPLEDTESFPSSDGKKLIGINVSPLVLNKSENPQETFTWFIRLIARLIKANFDICLLPHVMWAHDNDLTLLENIAKHFKDKVQLIPGTLSAAQYKKIVSGLYCLITARTHLSIAAYSTYTPVLVIGYSVKAKGLARDIYGEENGHVLSIQNMMNEEMLSEEVFKLIDRADQEKAFLKSRMKSYINGADAVVDKVLSL